MNDRDALYAAILAHPDEDTPRLVLADYLEEHGEADYAAFIRKQIELAKVPEWDPLWIDAFYHGKYTFSRAGKFSPKLPKDLEWPPQDAYRRGFLWQVHSRGTAPFLKHADKLVAQVPLQSLTFHNGGDDWRAPFDLSALLASPHAARLKHLGAACGTLTGDTALQMQACPRLCNLTSLAFEYTDFGPTALRSLFQAPLMGQLEELRFESRQLDWRTLVQHIGRAGGPHRLRRLAFTHYSTTQGVSPSLFAAPLLRGLRELEIDEFAMDERTIRALCASPVATSLESLMLSNVNPGAPGIAVLAECAALKNLKRLGLRQNSIGPVVAKHLALSPHLSGLQVLDLESNPLGDKGAIALAEAPCMANLLELDLTQCNIGDAGAKALMNALSAEKLISLTLKSDDVKLSASVKRKLRKKFGHRVFV